MRNTWRTSLPYLIFAHSLSGSKQLLSTRFEHGLRTVRMTIVCIGLLMFARTPAAVTNARDAFMTRSRRFSVTMEISRRG